MGGSVLGLGIGCWGSTWLTRAGLGEDEMRLRGIEGSRIGEAIQQLFLAAREVAKWPRIGG